MGFDSFMNTVRYWDNKMAKWIVRHFYILFFEVLLVFVFFIFFMNTIQVINVNLDMFKESTTERLLFLQTINSLIVVFLLLLNSFWMLYIFRSMIRFDSSLRDINFNILRLKSNK